MTIRQMMAKDWYESPGAVLQKWRRIHNIADGDAIHIERPEFSMHINEAGHAYRVVILKNGGKYAILDLVVAPDEDMAQVLDLADVALRGHDARKSPSPRSEVSIT